MDNATIDLRDKFAAEALNALIIKGQSVQVLGGEQITKPLVETAYKIADAMIEQRSK